MKIKYVSYAPSFTSDRRKIDVQGHIGTMYDNIHGKKSTFTPKNIIDTVEINNVKKVLVSSLSSLNPENSQYFQSETVSANEMRGLVGNDKVKLYPLLSCQPGISKTTADIEKLLDKGGFFGLKFHPTNTQKSIKDYFEIYSKYLSVAEKRELPCVFHSATDGFSDPVQIIRLAEEHPRLPVILYHVDLGAKPEMMSKTIDSISNSVKSGKSNIFVDISWLTDLWDNTESNKSLIRQTLEKIGVDRVLFGSDTPIAEMGDAKKYRQFSDFVENIVKETFGADVADKVFYQNAENLFFNKAGNIVETQVKNTSEKIFPTKGGLIFLGALTVGAIGFMFKFFHSDKSMQNNG